MTGHDDNHDSSASRASPRRPTQEPDAEGTGLPGRAAPVTRAGIMGWRKAERARLIEQRLAIPRDARNAFGERIAAHLEQAIGDPTGLIVSAYWPFRGEPDLRDLLQRVHEHGGRAALPVVVARGAPLIFRAWARGDRLERGVWNIPIPAAGAEVVVPNVVIAPVVGFDPACYRLGYGGGFFDRTLAAMAHKPHVFGVGHAQAHIATIHPMAHDIAMDAVITEEGIVDPATPDGG